MIRIMKTCSICFEETHVDSVSSCVNCMESGISCHSCDLKWAKQSKDPEVCSVCKNKSKQNISTIFVLLSVQPFSDHSILQTDAVTHLR